MRQNQLFNFKTSSRSTFITMSISLVVALMAYSAFAVTNLANIGPKINNQAPSISVLDTNKIEKSVKQLSGDKGLIIVFFRSAEWCPFCKKHLLELNDIAKEFKQLGYGLAGISYDNIEVLTSFSEKHNLAFPLLSDQNVKTMQAYGIVNHQYKPGDMNYGIPHPGVVIINEEGVVTDKHFYQGYKKRVKFDALLNALQKR